MSPLGLLLMRVLRTALFAMSALVALFIGLEIWKNWDGRQDAGFLAVLGCLFIGALWLAYVIGKEMRNNPSA